MGHSIRVKSARRYLKSKKQSHALSMSPGSVRKPNRPIDAGGSARRNAFGQWKISWRSYQQPIGLGKNCRRNDPLSKRRKA
jgi:hypothetical protein